MIRIDGVDHDADHVVVELIHELQVERDRYRAALEAIIANEEAYNRGDALSAYIAKTALGIPA